MIKPGGLLAKCLGRGLGKAAASRVLDDLPVVSRKPS